MRTIADRQISDLVAATSVQPADLFVLEQTGTAKKLTGQILINFLTALADGHGGIASIAKTSTSGLVDTYTITYADTTTSTFTVTNGAQGEPGDSVFLHIKYSADMPTSDADMSDEPDNYIGIVANNLLIDPIHYTEYVWFQWKGDTGDPAELASSVTLYQAGASGTVVPSGTWSDSPPIVPQGQWLWVQTTLTFNSGEPVVFYTATRQGVDGDGSPGVAVPLEDNTSGTVGSSLNFSREDHQHPTPLKHITAVVSSFPTTINDASITENMRVVNIAATPYYLMTSDITWATYDGSLALSATMQTGSVTLEIDLGIF